MVQVKKDEMQSRIIDAAHALFLERGYSGTSLNARITVRLYQGRRYILRIRLYFNFSSGETAVMLW